MTGLQSVDDRPVCSGFDSKFDYHGDLIKIAILRNLASIGKLGLKYLKTDLWGDLAAWGIASETTFDLEILTFDGWD